jgi:hypothetical protein
MRLSELSRLTEAITMSDVVMVMVDVRTRYADATKGESAALAILAKRLGTDEATARLALERAKKLFRSREGRLGLTIEARDQLAKELGLTRHHITSFWNNVVPFYNSSPE